MWISWRELVCSRRQRRVGFHSTMQVTVWRRCWLAGSYHTWQVECVWLDTATVDWFCVVQYRTTGKRWDRESDCRRLTWSSHAMSRLIRFISARWTRRFSGTRTPPAVPPASVSSTTQRLCCRVSLLDGTDMLVDLPVSHTHTHVVGNNTTVAF